MVKKRKSNSLLIRITLDIIGKGETIKPKTLQTILKQAGLSITEFEELL